MGHGGGCDDLLQYFITFLHVIHKCITSLWYYRQNGRLHTVFYSIHTCSLIPLIERVCSLFYTLFDIPSRSHTHHSMKSPYFSAMGSRTSISLSSATEYPFQCAFRRLKRSLNGVGCAIITGSTRTQIGRCCV